MSFGFAQKKEAQLEANVGIGYIILSLISLKNIFGFLQADDSLLFFAPLYTAESHLIVALADSLVSGPTYSQHVNDRTFGEGDCVFKLSVVAVEYAHNLIELGKQGMEIAVVGCHHLVDFAERTDIPLFTLSF